MKKLSFLLILLAAFGFSSPLYAENVTLSYANFPPYQYEENNQPSGVLVQIVQMIFKRAGIPVDFVSYPFKRGFEETKDGKVSGIFNFYKTEKRLANFDYSDPIILNPLVLFVGKDSPLKFSGSLEDLKGKRIGVMLGYTYGTAFDDSKLFEIDPSNSHEVNFTKLVSGRTDAYLCDKLVGLYVLDKEKMMSQVKLLPIPVKVMDGYIGFTKGQYTDVILKINKVIEEMKKNGEIDQILNQYVEDLKLTSSQ